MKSKKPEQFIKAPEYLHGGKEGLKKFLQKNLRYPKEALEKNIEGKVKLKFEIDHLGKVSNVQILHGLGFGCDEEAKRLAELLVFEPTNTRKLRVTHHKTMDIRFKPPAMVSKKISYEIKKSKTSTSKQKETVYSYSIPIRSQN